MVGEVRSVLTRPQAPAGAAKTPGIWLLLAGAATFAVALGGYVFYMVSHLKNYTLDPVDLAVYRSGGLIVRHVAPLYNPHLAAPLYDWVGYGKLHLPFTYTPFAAISFAPVSLVPWLAAQKLSLAVNIIALLAALWFTLGGLGYRRDTMVRLGATLLGAGVIFWTEPVLRTLYLGQVNLVLMALITWDLCQPDTDNSRWWKGFGTGVAAGIKLVPLIFIPYLLLARKFRQAAMACAGFAVTVLLGFVILPADSVKWWFGGLFVQGGRTGFVGWAGQPVARGHDHPADRQRERRQASLDRRGDPGRPGRRDRRGPARPQGPPHARPADGRADWAAGLADQLGSPLGVDRTRRGSSRRITRCKPGAGERKKSPGPAPSWPRASWRGSAPGRPPFSPRRSTSATTRSA